MFIKMLFNVLHLSFLLKNHNVNFCYQYTVGGGARGQGGQGSAATELDAQSESLASLKHNHVQWCSDARRRTRVVVCFAWT